VAVTVAEETITGLDRLGEISISFTVTRVLAVEPVDDGLGGLTFSEVPVAEPWTMDYDALGGGGPASWATRFDVSSWGLLAAREDSRRVGGAVIAFDTPGVLMLGGAPDVAVLWDLRVAPDRRGTGIGTLLFRAAEAWSRDRECRLLKVETQNINVDACHFYRRMGCVLASVDRFAYPDLPDEAQLIWAKDL
jgi:GNAT superfamily N-acetyltransferase